MRGFLVMIVKLEHHYKPKNKKELRGMKYFHGKPHQTDRLNQLKTSEELSE